MSIMKECSFVFPVLMIITSKIAIDKIPLNLEKNYDF